MFQGFSLPEQNWFKVPNEFISLSANMTPSEFVVVLYIMRHTWGFNKYGELKHITLDEFEYGKKRKDGSRMDEGTGLSRPSIIAALKRAVEDGYLVVQVNDTDAARVKRKWGLRIESTGSKNFTPEVKKLYPGGQKTLPRTGKDTNGKTPRSSYTTSRGGQPAKRTREGFLVTAFDRQAAGTLRSILIENNSHLVVPSTRSVKIETLAKRFAKLRTECGVPESEITDVLGWLEEHYDDTYTPELHKADDVYNRWARFRKAMKRQRQDEDNGESAEVAASAKRTPQHKRKRQLIDKVLDKAFEDGYLVYEGQLLDAAALPLILEELGEEPDAISYTFLVSEGREDDQ